MVLLRAPCLFAGQRFRVVWLLAADAAVRGSSALLGHVNGDLLYREVDWLGVLWRVVLHSRGVLGWLLLWEQVLVQQDLVSDVAEFILREELLAEVAERWLRLAAPDRARSHDAGDGGSGDLMLLVPILLPGLPMACLGLLEV